ncbi:hypothetical protein BV898_04586 [Hypsibius exemplaris]|uniref:Uncharacterized protein n=1 Tax=Hypsibius exemplaris TaxID=2072580 RepID=A0A1W0X1J9_HYPEX|nr:hypothetical protein BV898_04586 [Hypsibius exemplaris]
MGARAKSGLGTMMIVNCATEERGRKAQGDGLLRSINFRTTFINHPAQPAASSYFHQKCQKLSHPVTMSSSASSNFIAICTLFSTLLIATTPTSAAAGDLTNAGYFLADEQPLQPRLSIKSGGKAITRNVRRIQDLSAVSGSSTIHVVWNTTPARLDGLGIAQSACCSFTLLSVYPVSDSSGRTRSSAEDASVVLILPSNITEHTFHASTLRETAPNGGGPSLSRNREDGPSLSQISGSGPSLSQKRQTDKYLVCVQIWHRSRGGEKKLDEDCVAAQFLTEDSSGWNSNRNIFIIFIVVIAVNVVLIVTLVLVRHYRRGATRRSALPFAVKKWWKDVSDVLQEHGSARTEVLQENVRGEVNNGLSVVSNGHPIQAPLNNVMYTHNGRYQYPMPFYYNGPTIMRPVMENLYYGTEGVPSNAAGQPQQPQWEYSYVRQQQPPLPHNQIYYTRNGLFSGAAQTATV